MKNLVIKKALGVKLLLPLLFLVGCIDQIPFEFGEGVTRVVIDGMITNRPGPHTVRITTTRTFSAGNIGQSPPVTGAIVTISDDQGLSEELTEVEPGIYRTSPNGIQGQVGRSYALSVVLDDGTRYQSNPELLRSVPEIDSVYAQFTNEQVLNDQSLLEDNPGFDVFLDMQDDGDTRNFYLWNWRGTYVLITAPELHTVNAPGGGRVPDPKPCCAECYTNEYNTSILVSDDAFFNGRALTREKVAFIRVTPQSFNVRYQVDVEQLSITPAAFEFWNLLREQRDNVGSIFDPAPAQIRGNIVNLADPDDLVLGYFGASAVTRKSIVLDPEAIDIRLPAYEPIPDDCRVIENSSTVPPNTWISF